MLVGAARDIRQLAEMSTPEGSAGSRRVPKNPQYLGIWHRSRSRQRPVSASGYERGSIGPMLQDRRRVVPLVPLAQRTRGPLSRTHRIHAPLRLANPILPMLRIAGAMTEGEYRCRAVFVRTRREVHGPARRAAPRTSATQPVKARAGLTITSLRDRQIECRAYAHRHGVDVPEVSDWCSPY